MSSPEHHECQLCGRPAPLACSGCGAMFYCSEGHRRKHAAQLGHDAAECGRMAAAAAPERRQELAGHLGLPWAAGTHSLPPCAYLSQLGVHCAPGSEADSPTAWLRECSCGSVNSAPWGAAAPLHSLWAHSSAAGTPLAVGRVELVQQLGGWLGLPAAQAPCLLSSVPPSSVPPASWAAYYRLRGLPAESPAALLLDATLTLYSAVLRLHRLLAAAQQACGGSGQLQSSGCAGAPSAGSGGSGQTGTGSGESPLEQLPRLLPGGRLVLHLLGPQREVDQWPLLLELGCLLPRPLHIELHLIGPEVPAAMHGRSLHVAAPAAAPCGRPGCSCVEAWQAAGTCSAQAAAAAAAEPRQLAGESTAVSGEQQQAAGGMSLSFWRGAYHELAAELAQQHGPPHAVVAPNAGLAAYMSWLPTLQLLLHQLQGSSGRSSSSGKHSSQAPLTASGGSTGPAVQGPLVCCFTDFNSEAVHRSRQLLDYLLAGGAAIGSSGGSGSRGGGSGVAGSIVVQEGLNPFRKPAAVLASDNALPSASNGFALWLEQPIAQ